MGIEETVYEMHDTSNRGWRAAWQSIVAFDLRYLSSDQLFGIVLITAGIIGALIDGLRRNQFSVRQLTLGFAAGCVTFLAIKGGRHIFFVEFGADTLAFNAYSGAFCGLLAGLFTERGY